MKFGCCAICDFESNLLLNLLVFFKHKRIIQLYDPQTEKVAVTFEANIDESDCEHLQLWQQKSTSERQEQQQSNIIVFTLLITSIKLVEVHYFEFDAPGKHFRHLSHNPTVLTSGLPMEQLCLSLPVFDKRTSKIFLFSDLECFASTDTTVSNQSRQISFGKYAIMSDLGQINKLAGRYDDKLYFALAICNASSSSILLIYEDKRNSLFVVQWCKCVDSSKQIRIQWMQNFSSDMLTAVSCEDAHGFGNLACIACDQYLWLVSETGVVVKVATGISHTAPISALMTLPRKGEREDYSSLSSYSVTLQLVASAVNGEYYHIRVRGEVDSIAERASTAVAPTVRVSGTKIAKLSVSPVFGHSDRNRLHYHTTFLPFCRSMHFAMYRQSSFCFIGYHASFGVQLLQLSKSRDEPQMKLSFISSPLDQVTNISHGVTLQKEDRDPLRRFIFSSNDSVSGKSVLYKACEGISLLPHYTYALDALPDLTYFHIPSFSIPSATTEVHESLLLLSSRTNHCSSLYSLSYHSDSGSHELCTRSDTIRVDEATVGFFFVSSQRKSSLLQVTEKNIVLIKVIDNALVMDRCESFSSLFVHLDKSKKTLDLAANFTVQFYCYVNSCLYVAYRDTILTILVVDEPSAPSSFRLLSVMSTKFSISGLAAADMFEDNLKCICMSFWDSTTIDLHIVGDKGQFQQSCTIELAESSERMSPVVRYLCILPISVVGDSRTFDVIAASADGIIKAIRVVHSNSKTERRIDHGDVCTVAHLPGVNAMSVVDISSHATVEADHEISSPIVLVNGIGTDYILQLSMSSSSASPLSYSCVQFTQPRSHVQRRCLNIFQKRSVSKQRVPNTGGSNEVVVLMCMWLESLEAGSSLCIGFVDIQIEMSDDSKNKMLVGSLCIEHVTTIDGIIESMSLNSDKDILSLWCRPNASNGFNGWLIIIDAASFQIVWRRDIASCTETSPTDARHLKALEIFSAQRDGPSLEICYISADVCGAIAANFNVTMKCVVITATMISHSLNNNRKSSCRTIDRMEIPLHHNNTATVPTSGAEPPFDEEVQSQKYLGSGDVHSAILSSDVLLLILPDRRVVAVGFKSKGIEGAKWQSKAEKLLLLAELQVEWKSSTVTAFQCLLEKFAIIAVHGLGLVVVEYGDKEYLKHRLKCVVTVSLSDAPIHSISWRLASSLRTAYRFEPVHNVQIVCLDSSRRKLSQIFARLPFEDCTLATISSHPVIYEVEFRSGGNFDGIFQVIPLADNSTKSEWDFSCITSDLNLFAMRPKE